MLDICPYKEGEVVQIVATPRAFIYTVAFLLQTFLLSYVAYQFHLNPKIPKRFKLSCLFFLFFGWIMIFTRFTEFTLSPASDWGENEAYCQFSGPATVQTLPFYYILFRILNLSNRRYFPRVLSRHIQTSKTCFINSLLIFRRILHNINSTFGSQVKLAAS